MTTCPRSEHASRIGSLRLIPTQTWRKDPRDLKKGGKLQALQVLSKHSGNPIVFHGGQADADITSMDQKDLHTYGRTFRTQWVTIHDTSTDGFVSFNANALAKTKLATPFKRPERGQFRPGTGFREFYFDTTGDTNNLTEAASFGGFGAIFKLANAAQRQMTAP